MKFEYSQLIEDVQKKAVISVRSVRDVKLLKEDIESVTGLTISYNTLRRLFGFLERITPSLVTLNTLSQYLGFKSYGNYLNHKNNFEEDLNSFSRRADKEGIYFFILLKGTS